MMKILRSKEGTMRFWKRAILRYKNNKKISKAIRKGILLSILILAIPASANAAALEGGCVKMWGNGSTFTAVAHWHYAEDSKYRRVWSGYWGPWIQMQNRDWYTWHEWGSAPNWTISIQVAGWNRYSGWGYGWIGTANASWGPTPGCYGY